MRNEVDLLLEDLDDIRSNAETLGPGHPKVKKWIAGVRNYLTHEGNTRGLKRFEHLEFVQGGSEMWSQDKLDPSTARKLKAELDIVSAMLRKMVASSSNTKTASADQKMRELFLTPEEEKTEEEPVEKGEGESTEEIEEEPTVEVEKEEQAPTHDLPDLEIPMDKKIEPSFEAVTKHHFSSSAREQTIDQLMAELSNFRTSWEL
jgi:flagellar biosynthesis GTPase FlhF